MLVGRLCALNAKLKTDLTGNQVPSNSTTDLQIKKGRAWYHYHYIIMSKDRVYRIWAKSLNYLPLVQIYITNLKLKIHVGFESAIQDFKS